MELIITATLNPAQKQGIQSLVDICCQKDGLTLSFPFEEAELYLFYIEETGRVHAVAAFLKSGPETYECSAFTLPKSRQKGLFSSLLEEGISLLPPESDICFYSDGNCPASLGALAALGAELISEEHMMELPAVMLPEGFPDCRADQFPGSGEPLSGPCVSPSPVSVAFLPDGTLHYTGFHGQVSITPYETHSYLYGFEIQEPFRGQGYGRRLLGAVLADLAGRRKKPIRLQVAGDNLPAISLYKKTGFRITETLSCYLY